MLPEAVPLVALITALDESALAQQIGSGDRYARDAAFAELYRRHGARLLQYLSTKGLSREEREDVAAEAWARAWHKLDRYEYRDGVGFFPWLRKIADNVIHEFTRQRYLARGSAEPTPELDGFPATTITADEALVHLTQDEVRLAIVGLLPTVPNGDWRIAIEAHLVDGWQTDEIIELYGWSRNKVYQTKFRAFAWLKATLLERFGPTDIEAWLGDP